MKKIILSMIIISALSLGGNVFAYETAEPSHYEVTGNRGGEIKFTECAENDKLSLSVDYSNGIIALENKENGYIWYSSPLDADDDETASEIIKNELLSSVVLRYGVPEKRNDNNFLRSHTPACDMIVSEIENGVKIIYRYEAGFEFPVEYTLESDFLKASLKIADITELNPLNVASEITIMGSFGAGAADEEGFFVIPDGSGALVRFNSNRTADGNAYSQPVYGSNVTAVPVSAGAETEQIFLPVYGIVKEDNAVLVVASRGDSDSYITAKISGQSNSSYNVCRFTFRLRNTDTFYMSGNNTDRFTVFEQGEISSDDIELRYYPLSGENIGFVDVAERYRKYLAEECGVGQTKESPDICINLYGGAEKKKSVFGIPVTSKQPLTSYSEAVGIISELEKRNVNNIALSYENWTDDGIESRIDTKAESSSSLGGKKDFRKLTALTEESGVSFFPFCENRDFVSGNGYNLFNSTCVRISGAYSRIVSYDHAYGIPDGFSKNKSLLSPSCFSGIYSEAEKNFKSCGLSGMGLRNLTSSLYGDYGRKKISRSESMKITERTLENLSEDITILASGANAYALPFVGFIKDLPLNSGRFDIFSEDVPFLQVVLHGLIPYASEPLNSSPDYEKEILKAVATGSIQSYDLIHEKATALKDTELDNLYYAAFSGWTDEIAEKYNLLEGIYSDISGETITGYSQDGNIITTSYSNGTVTIIDLEEGTVDFNGNIINIGGK